MLGAWWHISRHGAGELAQSPMSCRQQEVELTVILRETWAKRSQSLPHSDTVPPARPHLLVLLPLGAIFSHHHTLKMYQGLFVSHFVVVDLRVQSCGPWPPSLPPFILSAVSLHERVFWIRTQNCLAGSCAHNLCMLHAGQSSENAAVRLVWVGFCYPPSAG